ncbi:MAG: RloB domain-containing protein [Desulfobacteraceae bacterium]|nr:MAG: RloB domain-containing protein [Desulfobacteraceae bacterium]
MGTDNLFHKKRIRRERELIRRANIRSGYDVVLIICEGAKTEPNYFKALRTHLRLNKENIVIHEGHKGNDPQSLAIAAEEASTKERSRDPEKQGYDRVFVVFDKDAHAGYNNALQKIDGLNKRFKGKFEAIVSVPCFELWLLLHFGYTTKPYAATGNKSPCDNLISDLEKHIPGYAKGAMGSFEKTKDFLDEAVKNARLLEQHQETARTDNPSTKVHHLVECLRGLSKLS